MNIRNYPINITKEWNGKIIITIELPYDNLPLKQHLELISQANDYLNYEGFLDKEATQSDFEINEDINEDTNETIDEILDKDINIPNFKLVNKNREPIGII